MNCKHKALLSCLALSLVAFGPLLRFKSAAAAEAGRSESPGRWRIHETSNFRICSRSRSIDLLSLASVCESLRSEMLDRYLGRESPPTWSPRCDVIVHSSLVDYQQSLGNGVGRSVGCATMRVDEGRVVSRRIDLRSDADSWQDDALPHELTHVVLLDRFGGRRLPPWADEGLGVLAESDRKQRQRGQVFADSADIGVFYQPEELLTLRRFPAPGLREAFYAQSAALVDHLSRRGTRQQFLNFVELAIDIGEHAALARVYGIHHVDELQTITRPHLVMKSLSAREGIEPVGASFAKLAAVTGD